MLRAFLERRRIEKTLGSFVSPETARRVADGTAAPPVPRERSIDFALISLAAADAAAYSARAAAVAETASRHQAVIQSLTPIVVVAFGLIESAPSEGRAGFIAEMQSQFGDAAIVHGRVIATVGIFGGDSFLDVGFWWPGIADALRELARLTPGQVQEFP